MLGMHDIKTRSCMKTKQQVSEIKKPGGARWHKVIFHCGFLGTQRVKNHVI